MSSRNVPLDLGGYPQYQPQIVWLLHSCTGKNSKLPICVMKGKTIPATSLYIYNFPFGSLGSSDLKVPVFIVYMEKIWGVLPPFPIPRMPFMYRPETRLIRCHQATMSIVIHLLELPGCCRGSDPVTHMSPSGHLSIQCPLASVCRKLH